MPKKERTIDSSDFNPIRRRGGMKFIFFLIFIALIAFAGYSYWNWQNTQEKLNALSSIEGQQALVKQEIAQLVKKMSQHIVLPEGEEPTLATITDIDALVEEQPFYEGASNGDKILIYEKAKKGFVYDPVRDLIVNVGPVFVEGEENGEGLGTLPESITPEEEEE